MRDKTDYVIVDFSKAILIYGLIALSFIGLGFYSFITLEHEGHWITGMNNQVVWGLPHVFAIFLIIHFVLISTSLHHYPDYACDK